MSEISNKFKEVKEFYKGTSTTDTFNGLFYGDSGVGKTTLLVTCRRPILIHSFDPGGTKSIIDYAEEPWLAIDNRFEAEDPTDPWVYEEWLREMQDMERNGIFSMLGTYVIDSATTWAQAIMNHQLKAKGRAGAFPFQEDYGPQMARIESHLKSIAGFACDCIITAHEDINKDERTGRMYIGPLLTGKLKTRVPLLFDELYGVVTNEGSDGEVVYELLTQNDGLRKCRTRIGRRGLFDKYEKPDVKYLLKKAGLNWEDKPYD